jgi:branched-chain amino acid transport system ATP-binding protein
LDAEGRPPVLRTDGLGLRIGGVTIVDDVSLSVREGEFLVIIGPNGAGKTTLFNLLSGVTRPTAGRVEFAGRDITHAPTYVHARLGMGRTFQTSSVFAGLSTLENARLAAQAYLGGSASLLRLAEHERAPLDRAREALAKVGLSAREGVRAASLSHGEKRKLDLAILLCGEPRVVLLDEPTAGMAVEDVPEMMELIGRIHHDGRAPHGSDHGPGRPDGGDAPRCTARARHAGAHRRERGRAVGLPGRSLMNARATLLGVRDLHVYLGESHILQGVSFDVREGGVTGLLGRNGVGKTTTLRGILGMVPRSGSVTLDGAELVGLRTPDIVRRGVGYVPEDRDVFTGLTVEENLRLAERTGSPLRYELVYELFPELKVRAGQRAGTLSGGQQQMVSLARALLNAQNRLLLIDEPTKGLAPLVVRSVVEALRRAAQVATILLVEQNLSVAHTLVGDVIVLDQGRVSFTGQVDELMDDPALARRYLGLSTAGSH